MKLKKIKIQGFKSIYDELILDFSKITGLWKLEGTVGAGKTTIGEAIIFGLFGTVSGKNNSDLISWGLKHGVVETWCSSNGADLYIKRELNSYGQSPLYVEVNGEELVFTNKRDGQSQLEQEYYDVSRATLELLCIISFNNFKSLTTLNTSDTKKFLDQVVGFYTLSRYAEACKELRKKSTLQAGSIESEMINNQGQINKIFELTSMSRIDGDITQVRTDILNQESLRDDVLKSLDETLTEYRKNWGDIQGKLSSIKTLGQNKKKEIDFIKKGKCPTCGAPIDQSQLKTKESERQLLLEMYTTESDKASQVQNDINNIETQRKQNVIEYRDKISVLKNKLTQLQEQEKRSNISASVIESLNDKNRQLEKDLSVVNTEIAEWDALYNILSEEVRTKILASFIPTLNKNILNYTQKLHQTYIIEYDINFKCSIRICGMDNNIPLSSLSTGQLKTIDMCVIMGILGTIMGNISFNIHFFDELFCNLDEDLRESMCKLLLDNLKPDETLFVISHVPLESKYFDGSLMTTLQYFDEVHKKSIYTSKNSFEEH